MCLVATSSRPRVDIDYSKRFEMLITTNFVVAIAGQEVGGIPAIVELLNFNIVPIPGTNRLRLEGGPEACRSQISDLAEQRDLGRRRGDRAEEPRQQLDARLHETLETAKSEREDWTEYVRSVENRTHSDVDRSRQEAKDLQAQLNNQAKAQRAIEEQLRKELHAAQAAAVSAGQATDVLQDRCEALEKQLSSLRELPAQLEAAFKRNTPKEAAPTLRARRQSPKST